MFAFLLFVVPFQMVWASVVPYCAHETNIAAEKHLGHHEHRHQEGGESTSAMGDQGDDSHTLHADCETCHLGCTVALPTQAVLTNPVPGGATVGYNDHCYTSHVPSGPERPDRSEPNPAARFGGGAVFGSLNA
jgi:hypothetical protein